MTWDQYQQWKQAMQDHIDRKIESMRLIAGSNVIVQGNLVSLIPVERPEVDPQDQTWDYYIFGRVRYSFNGAPMSEWGFWEDAYTVGRRTGIGVQSPLWEQTQLIANSELTRSFDIELESRGVETWQIVRAQDIARLEGNLSMTSARLMELSRYFIPCRLVVGEYAPDAGGGMTTLVREHSFEVRRATVRRSFSPSQSYTELRPIRVERL